MNPDSPSAAYGYAGMGPYQGGQSEFVLVPSADFNYLKLGVWRSFEGCCGSLCGRQGGRRLEKAKELGAIPVDFIQGDPVERIFEIRQKHHGIQQSRRPGEEKLRGVDWCYRCSWLPSQGR